MEISPFHANFPFIYPLRPTEKKLFFDDSRGYRNGIMAGNGLISCFK